MLRFVVCLADLLAGYKSPENKAMFRLGARKHQYDPVGCSDYWCYYQAVLTFSAEDFKN